MSYIGKKPTSSFASATSQTFTGNNSLTEFTLNRRVSAPEDLEVFVSNVQQQPTTSYTIEGSGLTLKFSEAPPSGQFYVVYRSEAGTSAIDTGAVRTIGDQTITGDLTVTSSDDGAGGDPNLVILRNSASPADQDQLGRLTFRTKSDTDQLVDAVQLRTKITDVSNDTEEANLEFYVSTNGSLSNRLTIKGNGVSSFSNQDLKLNTGVDLIVTGNEIKLDADGDTSITADTDDRIDFKVGGTDVIHINGANLGVGTSSPDAKLDVEGTTDAELRITRTTASASGTFNDQGSVLNLFNDVEFENGYNGGASVGQILFTSDDGSTGQGIRSKIACIKSGYSHAETLGFYISPANTTSGQVSATSNSTGLALELGYNKNLYHRATRLDDEHSTFPNIHIGQKSSFGSFDAGSTYIVNNAYYTQTQGWKKKVTGASNLVNMSTDGDWYFQYNGSASAGTTNLSFSNRYLLNDNGGGIYLYSDGHGNGSITMYNNNIYIASNSGSGEVYATDAAGNHSLLSPHNFKYIPEGKSADNAWSYLSEKVTPTTRKDANDKDEIDTDRKDGDSFTYVNVDMMKVVREVEKLTGTKLVYTGKDGKDDGSTVKDNIIADLIKRIEVLENK